MQVTLREIGNVLTRTTGFLKTVTSHSLQPYSGCTFGNSLCGVGCYVRHNSFVTRGRPWGGFLEVRENAASSYRRHWRRERNWAQRRRGGFGIFLSSSTEPFLPHEFRHRVTKRVLEAMLERPPDLLVLPDPLSPGGGLLGSLPGSLAKLPASGPCLDRDRSCCRAGLAPPRQLRRPPFRGCPTPAAPRSVHGDHRFTVAADSGPGALLQASRRIRGSCRSRPFRRGGWNAGRVADSEDGFASSHEADRWEFHRSGLQGSDGPGRSRHPPGTGRSEHRRLCRPIFDKQPAYGRTCLSSIGFGVGAVAVLRPWAVNGTEQEGSC